MQVQFLSRPQHTRKDYGHQIVAAARELRALHGLIVDKLQCLCLGLDLFDVHVPR